LKKIQNSIIPDKFIKKLEEYITIGQYIRDKEYWHFNMEDYIKSQCEAVENAKSNVISFLKRYSTLNGRSVLEIGCGFGGCSVALALEGAKVTAVDLDSNALDVAKLRAKEHGVEIGFNKCDARNLAYESNFYDCVICIQVLEHIPKGDNVKALKESFRVLKKDGIIYIDTPNQYFPKDEHDTGLWFIHWLPKRISIPYARLRKRDVPTIEPSSGRYVGSHDILSYSKIINTLRKEGEIQVLTNFQIYENINDFYTWNKIEIYKSLTNQILFKLLKIGCKIININKILPIRVIIMKKRLENQE
jgi:ubiquinone/menaquinone biosynthesis C-methylase UbiE